MQIIPKKGERERAPSGCSFPEIQRCVLVYEQELLITGVKHQLKKKILVYFLLIVSF